MRIFPLIAVAALVCLLRMTSRAKAADSNLIEFGIEAGNLYGIDLGYEHGLSEQSSLRLQINGESSISDRELATRGDLDLGFRHYFSKRRRFSGPYLGAFLEASYRRNQFGDYSGISGRTYSTQESPYYGGGLETGYQWALGRHFFLGFGADFRYFISQFHGQTDANGFYYPSAGGYNIDLKLSFGRSF